MEKTKENGSSYNITLISLNKTLLSSDNFFNILLSSLKSLLIFFLLTPPFNLILLFSSSLLSKSKLGILFILLIVFLSITRY